MMISAGELIGHEELDRTITEGFLHRFVDWRRFVGGQEDVDSDRLRHIESLIRLGAAVDTVAMLPRVVDAKTDGELPNFRNLLVHTQGIGEGSIRATTQDDHKIYYRADRSFLTSSFSAEAVERIGEQSRSDLISAMGACVIDAESSFSSSRIYRLNIRPDHGDDIFAQWVDRSYRFDPEGSNEPRPVEVRIGGGVTLFDETPESAEHRRAVAIIASAVEDFLVHPFDYGAAHFIAPKPADS